MVKPGQEHILIQRWEDMVDVFQSPELVNQLIEDEPSILRWPRRTARNALHYLEIYLGEEVRPVRLVVRHVVSLLGSDSLKFQPRDCHLPKEWKGHETSAIGI